MKILYGVQGTGNGHITRARRMSKYLSAAGVSVDYVFSGRDGHQYYAMEPFGDWRCLNGLTFSVAGGKVNPLTTLQQARPLQFLKDVRSLPVSTYDLVISDFEPVTAWAARRRKIDCLGIGHQYAFEYPIPKAGSSPLTRSIMRHFAPAGYSLGMHWYHFGQPIAPPIIDTWQENVSSTPGTIIVYLPFEDPRSVVSLLQEVPDYHFLYYGAFPSKRTTGNISTCPVSREGFQKDLARSDGVISNAGFELASEAISLGKKLLVKPLGGQMEQLSNALALEALDLGRATKTLTPGAIRDWLHHFAAQTITYPDVAKHLVGWILKGNLADREPLIQKLWAETRSHGLHTFQAYTYRGFWGRASSC